MCFAQVDAPVVLQADAPTVSPGPCAVQVDPAAGAALLRKSEDRPQPPFSVGLVPTVLLPIPIGTLLSNRKYIKVLPETETETRCVH